MIPPVEAEKEQVLILVNGRIEHTPYSGKKGDVIEKLPFHIQTAIQALVDKAVVAELEKFLPLAQPYGFDVAIKAIPAEFLKQRIAQLGAKDES